MSSQGDIGGGTRLRHRLNIGCGDRPTEGWINYDNSPSILLGKIPFLPKILRRLGLISSDQLDFIDRVRSGRADGSGSIRYADVTKRIPEPDRSVDTIYTCHMLEHLSRTEADHFLRESHRVLAPGGKIRIVVPDLRMLTENYLRELDADRFVESLYIIPEGPVSRLGRLKYLLIGGRLHLWMYDGDSLRALLRRAGFADSRILRPGETTLDDPTGIDLQERSEESLYVEAIKV